MSYELILTNLEKKINCAYLEVVHIGYVKSDRATLLEWEYCGITVGKRWSQIWLYATCKYPFIFSLPFFFKNGLLLWCFNRTWRNLDYSSYFLSLQTARLCVNAGQFSCLCCSCWKGFSNVTSKWSGPLPALNCPNQCIERRFRELQKVTEGFLLWYSSSVILLS